MKITKEEVAHVAQLARLEFAEEEMDSFTFQLNRILEYIDKLNELDTSGVNPMTHPLALCNAFREDMVAPSLPDEIPLMNAPAPRGRFFSVPRVIE